MCTLPIAIPLQGLQGLSEQGYLAYCGVCCGYEIAVLKLRVPLGLGAHILFGTP